jgi:DNA helicase-2/ATP-dependent DNA helicase PcrA
MAIRDTDKKAAEDQQLLAAQDPASRIRLAAGPGTGKSKTIEKRILWALEAGTSPKHIYVTSFTRASAADLERRIRRSCSEHGQDSTGVDLRVSTMHSLALSLLRQSGQLAQFPTAHPLVLDDWEQTEIYDAEFARFAGCTASRAKQIRLAHDAAWQTLDESFLAQAKVTPTERARFEAFHAARTNLYCCVLPGELVYRCVKAIEDGSLPSEDLPEIAHLIVDEFQDLNACDQDFARLLADRGAALFVAGDDDQSIYLFRHARPEGIVNFTSDYPGASTHILKHCFRCPPAILEAATKLIRHNPSRVEKDLESLLEHAEPPVPGILKTWSFSSGEAEAQAIAESCRALLDAGMAGREDQICILVSGRGPSLDALIRELANLGLPYEVPVGDPVTAEPAVRVAYSLLRIVRDRCAGREDYPAHRALLGLLRGVGPSTAKETAEKCIENNHNFREIFYVEPLPGWLISKPRTAVERVRRLIGETTSWSLDNTLQERGIDLTNLIQEALGADAAEQIADWNALIGDLPPEMTLNDMIEFLEADSEAEQAQILDEIKRRAGGAEEPPPEQPKRIRILTMHAAKGLDGLVVFLPSLEQGILPSFKALRATGLVMEQRRLFYVGLTRSRAVCIVSHATSHTGPVAYRLRQRPYVSLPRSQFLNEMGVKSVNRSSGLSNEEAAEVVAEIRKLD